MTAALDSPTLGAWYRAHGITPPCPEARHMLACAIAEEARRRALIDRLDGILRFLCVGGTVDQATIRLRRLTDDLVSVPAEAVAA